MSSSAPRVPPVPQVDAAVERLAELTALVDSDPVAAERELTALLEPLLVGLPQRPEEVRTAQRPRLVVLARLLVLRARARHFRRDLAAHDDTGLALELLDVEDDQVLAAQALNMHAISSGYLGDLNGQLRCLDRGLDAVLRTPGEEARRLRSIMRHNLAVSLYDLGDARGALGLLADARREAVAIGRPRQLEWVLMSSVAAASFLLRGYEGQPPVEGAEREELMRQVATWTAEAVEAAERAVREGDGTANRRGASWCLARLAQLEGELEVALGHAQASVRQGGSLGEVDVLARSRALLAEVLLDLGRLDEAEEILLLATDDSDRLGSVTSVMVWHMLATCRERRGDLRGALAAMRRYVTAVTASRDLQVHSTAAVNAARLRREEVERERDTWRRTSEDEHRAARVDPLTGVANRRAFNDAVAQHARAGTRLALAIIDLDHFKTVNDRFGHLVGDEVLRLASDTMRVALSEALGPARLAGSGLFRVGGEEFVVVFEVGGLDEAGVVDVVDEVRSRLCTVDWGAALAAHDRDGGTRLAVTASAGVAVGVPVQAPSPAGALLRAADAYLYEAKHAGRDLLRGPRPGGRDVTVTSGRT